MSFLQLDAVSKNFGTHSVIKGVSISAEKGEFVVFVGPSGCGKSTLLRMISGLESVNGGKIHIDGRDVTYIAPAEREVAMVFQSYALYPHMSVFENMAFGLRMIKVEESKIRERVTHAARTLQIEELLARKPRELSGGQRQRVAIGRAIVRNPKLFLFDEPLSNLDAELRTRMRVEIAKLHKDLGATMVYVTHDQIEAMTLADRIVVLRDGNVEQFGTPTELYDRPANTFVAGFIGSPKMNFLDAVVTSVDERSASVKTPAFHDGNLKMPLKKGHEIEKGQKTIIGMRPEHLTINATKPVLNLKVDITENLGGMTQVHARSVDGATVAILAPGRPQLASGDMVKAGIPVENIYVFNSNGLAV